MYKIYMKYKWVLPSTVPHPHDISSHVHTTIQTPQRERGGRTGGGDGGGGKRDGAIGKRIAFSVDGNPVESAFYWNLKLISRSLKIKSLHEGAFCSVDAHHSISAKTKNLTQFSLCLYILFQNSLFL